MTVTEIDMGQKTQRKLNAKRRATTRKGRKAELLAASDWLMARRAENGGSVSVSPDFPLDVMLAKGWLSEQQHQAGWAFAGLRWRCFGPPPGSVAGFYDRLVAAAGDDFHRWHTGIEAEEEVERLRRARGKYDMALNAIRGAYSENGVRLVSGAASFVSMPLWAARLARGHYLRDRDVRDRKLLLDCLDLLVEVLEIAARPKEVA